MRIIIMSDYESFYPLDPIDKTREIREDAQGACQKPRNTSIDLIVRDKTKRDIDRLYQVDNHTLSKD